MKTQGNIAQGTRNLDIRKLASNILMVGASWEERAKLGGETAGNPDWGSREVDDGSLCPNFLHNTNKMAPIRGVLESASVLEVQAKVLGPRITYDF